MMFLTKLMLLTAAETDADLSTVLEETRQWRKRFRRICRI